MLVYRFIGWFIDLVFVNKKKLLPPSAQAHESGANAEPGSENPPRIC